MEISDMVWVALISAIPPTIASIAALVVSVKNSRKLDEVHHATNGMKDALVEATRVEATAVGKAEGIEGERVRTEAIVASTTTPPLKGLL
jgi:hypothetical protein